MPKIEEVAMLPSQDPAFHAALARYLREDWEDLIVMVPDEDTLRTVYTTAFHAGWLARANHDIDLVSRRSSENH
ncbi:MAG: hypothetical protein V1755_06665 [Chloroflexota bacterium]